MLAQRLHLKVHVAPSSTVTARELVPVFHRFIQTRRLDELMIDVTDYSHVPDGPGVILICHAANYAFDRGGRRAGLLYGRKRDADGDFAARLRATFRAALTCARELEREPGLAGKLAFAPGELSFRIMDRLLAPNEPATFAAVEPALAALCGRLYGAGYTLTHEADPARCFEVDILSPSSPDVATLLARIA